ncbi:transcriptional regulator, SARP family protein [Peterkaempfera bronchialis]|uniref:Transcriptional regulator, SARP family protein n=2 Tax=Peterkaempfera bronchialis TaxID=2126346 RepID=A0A345SXK3_9ACTN|nr:transcriptional regulator, SARP family protein [Peterkaempfera bronchialis]
MLGPVTMVRDGRPCTPSALKQRALLALLLLSANVPVPAHRLIEGLWGSRPPQAAAATLQVYVSCLRRALDPAHGAANRDPRHHPLLRTEATGYRMRVAPGELDLDRFRTLTATGRRHLAEGRCQQAGEALGEALALWRGRPFADLEHSGLLGSYGVRLEEERLSALGDHMDVVLCRGRSHEVVDVIGELRELCAAHPLRESFHETLIRALCRVGRRAEALTAYTRVRGMLIAELGIEPGPGLKAAQLVALEAREPYGIGHLRCR